MNSMLRRREIVQHETVDTILPEAPRDGAAGEQQNCFAHLECRGGKKNSCQQWSDYHFAEIDDGCHR